MKDLFTGFFSISLSGSLILCIVFLLRLVLRKAPKTLICVLWTIVFVRLLIPFQIKTSWSLRPDTPVFSVTASYSAEQRTDKVVEVTNNSLQLPAQYENTGGIDVWQIVGSLWIVGVAAMLTYTLISYLRLKQRLRGAQLVQEGVYISRELNSAILLGYFRPRIYLPYETEAEDVQLVVAHERAHLRRGDNWLKLLGFVALGLHWYNPLVWVAYLLLCRDVEDACDAYVVRDLDSEGKKRYSAALLSCGTQKRSYFACPVAFGEISIRHRILNVLNYRKPTLWITIVALVAIIAATVFFMTDPIQEHPPYYETLSGLLGQPMETVFSALGLEESEIVTVVDGVYLTPIRVTYLGLPFQLELTSGRSGVPFSQFSYVAEYDPEDTKAEEDIVSISRYYWDTLGEGYQSEHKQKKDILSYISKKTLRRNIEANKSEQIGTPILYEEWDVTDDNKAILEKPFAEIKKLPQWDAMTQSATTPDVTTVYDLRQFLRFTVQYNYLTDLVQVKLTYLFIPVTERYPDYVYGYIEKQTWWDKLWNWAK